MHLMSFYATPYNSRHRNESNQKRLPLVRGLWFGVGLLCGVAGMYVAMTEAPSSETEIVSLSPQPLVSDPAAEMLVSEVMNPTPEQEIRSLLLPQATQEAELTNTLDTALSDNVHARAKDTWPKTVKVTVDSGDTLIDMLMHQGIDSVAAHRLAKQVNKTYNLRRLRPGHSLTLTLKQDATRSVAAEDGVAPTILEHMTMHVSKLETVEVQAKGDDAYSITKAKKKLVTEAARVKGVITSSLYLTAARQGMPDGTIAKIIKNFSYDVDFQRDVKSGDVIDVMYETQKTEDGEFVSGGNILYAKLKSKGRTYTQYQYTNHLGLPAYYNEKGESIVKRLLKTPIDGARVSSRYGMRRHPVMGYNKMHKGVDFAATTGTPIYAAGDGIVTFAGRKGGYGKFVLLKHNLTYSTAYAHASRIHPRIKAGTRVKQGQIIAYVGTTGRSTGPHLHYEIRKHGHQVNPLHVKFTGGNKLTGKQLASFKEHVKSIDQKLVAMQTNEMIDPEVLAKADTSAAQE